MAVAALPMVAVQASAENSVASSVIAQKTERSLRPFRLVTLRVCLHQPEASYLELRPCLSDSVPAPSAGQVAAPVAVRRGFEVNRLA